MRSLIISKKETRFKNKILISKNKLVAKIVSEYSKSEEHFDYLYVIGILKFVELEKNIFKKNINKSGLWAIRTEIINNIQNMENKILELEKSQNEFDLEISKIINRDGVSGSAFYDGIINFEKYLESELKIMWVLKEPNSTEEGLNWRNEIKGVKTENGTKYGWSGTFNPIIYVTYGIKESLNWNQIPYTKDKPEIIDILETIAFLNVKKTPGESVSFDNEIHEYHRSNRNLLLSQIKSCNPDVIICGNTFKYIGEDLKVIYQDLNHKVSYINGMEVYNNSNLIVIDTFHPNARKNKEKYCDNIINSVLDWKKIKF